MHALLWYLTSISANLPLGDVTITYRRWIETGQASGFWVGIDEDWVYPILAIVPMAAAAIGGVGSIGAGWLVLVTVLDAVACAFLWRFRALGVRVVWWWLAFLLALGPIGLGRIDSVATVLALIGVAFVATRPAVASALFTAGAWTKVWPAALVGSSCCSGAGTDAVSSSAPSCSRRSSSSSTCCTAARRTSSRSWGSRRVGRCRSRRPSRRRSCGRRRSGCPVRPSTTTSRS
ncbi:hypothetical protein P9139_16170 [Curtobacterium flaccumfaciens]|nr:hypothetical protein P9139_16170 [Curtobacterium flaccumfaciens]